MTRVRLGAAAAALALLAGCGGAERPSADNVMMIPPANALDGKLVVPGENGGNATVADAHARPLLNLAPDGLTLVDPESGSSRHVTFEMPRETAIQMVSAALDAPGEQGEAPECGAGPLQTASFQGDLTLYFQEGKFAGWFLDEKGGYSTANGIRNGMTLAALREAAGEVRVEETTLDHEFSDDDQLYGFLSGPKPTDTVKGLWAGVSCFFR